MSFFNLSEMGEETLGAAMYRVRSLYLVLSSTWGRGVLVLGMFSLLPCVLARDCFVRLALDVVVARLAAMDAQDCLGDLSCSCTVWISSRSPTFLGHWRSLFLLEFFLAYS